MPLYIPVSGSEPSDFQPAIVTNNYYFTPFAAVEAAISPNNGIMNCYPIWFSHTETWTRIGVNVATGSGTATEKVRLGIWENGAGNLPGALLLDTGELSIETSGEKEATISVSLSANTLYWIGYNGNGDNGVAQLISCGGAYHGNSPFTWTFGTPDLSGITDFYGSGYFGFYRSLAYGALPDPFGTPGGYVNSAPAIWLRKV